MENDTVRTIEAPGPGSILEEIARQGAQRMLAQAMEAEVAEFLAQHAERRDDNGHQLAVRNGHMPERDLITGIGPVLDQSGAGGSRQAPRAARGGLRDGRQDCRGARGRDRARHLLPSFRSGLIVSLTLSIPAMILGETALSFLGIGIQPPAISWGALLQSAQNVRSVALAPWLFIPGLFIVVTVLAYNFVGDGLRDAADPYA